MGNFFTMEGTCQGCGAEGVELQDKDGKMLCAACNAPAAEGGAMEGGDAAPEGGDAPAADAGEGAAM